MWVFTVLHDVIISLFLGTVLVTTQVLSLEMVDLEKSYHFQAEPIPVEVQFITQKDQNYAGDTKLLYHASLCGGAFFDGLMAHVAVNLANNPWSSDSGDYITVTANDSSGHVLASNIVPGSKSPMPDFNFTYNMK